eukprot:793802-Prorocentrum_minimum.AAC.3
MTTPLECTRFRPIRRVARHAGSLADSFVARTDSDDPEWSSEGLVLEVRDAFRHGRDFRGLRPNSTHCVKTVMLFPGGRRAATPGHVGHSGP